jgi:hypothetical protein
LNTCASVCRSICVTRSPAGLESAGLTIGGVPWNSLLLRQIGSDVKVSADGRSYSKS